jgi:hypothetical protein
MAKSKKPGGSKRAGYGVDHPTVARQAPNDDAYNVGRARPPRHTQFKKGESGNKAGRPRGSKNLSTLIMEAAHGQVTATIDGKQRKISKVQATTMQLATKAAAGDPKAMLKFLDWVDEIEARAAAARPSQFPVSAADIEVIKAVHDRLWTYSPDPFDR